MNWIFPNLQSDIVRNIMDLYQVPESIANVMVARSLTDIPETKEFFSPNVSQLHDPFLMKGMDQAVARVIQNIESEIPIFVFGDYDVDGTTAASLLYVGLTNLGATVKIYSKSRKGRLWRF